MSLPDTEQFIKELFRENLSTEVSRAGVQSEKAQFLASFYAGAPAPTFSPFQWGFVFPFLMLSAILFGTHAYQVTQAPEAGPSAPLYRTFGDVLKKAKAERAQVRAIVKSRQEAERQARLQAAQQRRLEDPVRNHMTPRVIVKRLSSNAGATLVYQRAYRETPVTIVWVFPNAGGKA